MFVLSWKPHIQRLHLFDTVDSVWCSAGLLFSHKAQQSVVSSPSLSVAYGVGTSSALADPRVNGVPGSVTAATSLDLHLAPGTSKKKKLKKHYINRKQMIAIIKEYIYMYNQGSVSQSLYQQQILIADTRGTLSISMLNLEGFPLLTTRDSCSCRNKIKYRVVLQD